MCKPIMMTKATSCNPIRVGKITQTEYGNPDEKKLFVPVPFPLIIPTPLLFNVAPTPNPLPLPSPVLVPYVTPLSQEAIQKALKQLKEFHDKLPENEKGTEDDDLKLVNILKELQIKLTESSEVVSNTKTVDDKNIDENELNAKAHGELLNNNTVNKNEIGMDDGQIDSSKV
ncbi:hypothetical protein HELRODRAFT_174256 [Helobdella robusta]|uniref:Uncharacterized protein n=1 Tax=Helobdella robusta TaxID=6412 RepID=T1F7W5_HELRO|nr:hypothetical protein HELRODRAFT_174256 [Helobdella robusta]ESO02832.1 hypothetical protein HELRODRAFT_174256 [Helobdella robusta]